MMESGLAWFVMCPVSCPKRAHSCPRGNDARHIECMLSLSKKSLSLGPTYPIAKALFCAHTCVDLLTLSLPARQVLFDRFDTDGNGTLDEKEFVDACSLMGLRFPIMELSMMFRNVDADCSGGIDLDEFTDLIKLLRWKRMGLLTMGMWQSGKAEIELGGLGMFQNWEEQQTWLENQILQG